MKKAIAVIPAGQIHYIDHLAVVAILMGIPLLFLDEQDYQLAENRYPGLVLEKMDYLDFNSEFLIANYDVVYGSDIWKQETFEKQFQELEKTYQKKLRRVFCPHGFSDKEFYFKACMDEDICLIYGQNMLDMFERLGILNTLKGWVLGGNYRYTYYKQHKEFYDRLIQQEVFHAFDPSKKTILYAPTWQDFEDASTFFDNYTYILEKLPQHYNLIVKLHPHLEMNDPGAYYHIMGKYEGRHPRIVFLREFPLVYPILAHADLYIGDTSSVGYDFLTFNRPMFFLNKNKRNPQTDRGLFLYRCGIDIQPEQFPQLYEIIDSHLAERQSSLEQVRAETYAYTFGPERSFEKIKEELIQAAN